MKKLVCLILALVMVLACGCAFAEADGSLDAIIGKGALVLGLDDAFPPMGFRDDDNNIVGYDIDVAAEVAARLGVELVCQPIDWASKELELDSGNIDCIWNGMSITPKRQASMAMAIPYMNSAIVMVARDSEGFTSIADMEGRIIGVQSGSFSEEVLETYEEYADFCASVEVAPYDEYLTALLDLQQGGIDGVLIDLVVAEYCIAGLGDDSFVIVDSLEDDLFGVGFRKDDLSLRDKVNDILLEMAEDGILAEISTKWFGSDISIVGKEGN